MKGERLFISEDKKTIAMLILKGTEEIYCGGSQMQKLVANTTDTVQEKHVPEVKVEGKKISVQVGSVLHPMTPEHLICWIYLQTKKGGQYKILTPQDKPEATFTVQEDDEPVAVYEFCNLHGLWKKDL